MATTTAEACRTIRGRWSHRCSQREPTGHHGGVHGGAIAEPMQDLLAVTASLVDASGMVLVPGFYDEAVQRTQGELDRCEFRIEDYKKELCDAGLRSAGRGAE
eukprot:Polyplicarium_translucidae@DN2303_c0_g1_i1.p5